MGVELHQNRLQARFQVARGRRSGIRKTNLPSLPSPRLGSAAAAEMQEPRESPTAMVLRWRDEARVVRSAGQGAAADTMEALAMQVEAAAWVPGAGDQTTAPEWPQFLTVSEAAELARMSPSWVYGQAAKRPPWIERRGSQIRIEAAGFRQWLADGDEEAAA